MKETPEEKAARKLISAAESTKKINSRKNKLSENLRLNLRRRKDKKS
jgi:hypothetical protein